MTKTTKWQIAVVAAAYLAGAALVVNDHQEKETRRASRNAMLADWQATRPEPPPPMDCTDFGVQLVRGHLAFKCGESTFFVVPAFTEDWSEFETAAITP